jgi:hypothetical protein
LLHCVLLSCHLIPIRMHTLLLVPKTRSEGTSVILPIVTKLDHYRLPPAIYTFWPCLSFTVLVDIKKCQKKWHWWLFVSSTRVLCSVTLCRPLALIRGINLACIQLNLVQCGYQSFEISSQQSHLKASSFAGSAWVLGHDTCYFQCMIWSLTTCWYWVSKRKFFYFNLIIILIHNIMKIYFRCQPLITHALNFIFNFKSNEIPLKKMY